MAAEATKPAVAAVLPQAPKSMAAIRFEETMLKDLLEMFADLHAESPMMKLFVYNEERVKRAILTAIARPGHICGFACVDFTNQSILGLIIGSVGLTYFSEEPIANDVVLYMRPEYRNEFVAKQLLDAYTAWATRLEIKKMFFSHLSGVSSTMLAKTTKALGWKVIGQQMMKVVE